MILNVLYYFVEPELTPSPAPTMRTRSKGEPDSSCEFLIEKKKPAKTTVAKKGRPTVRVGRGGIRANKLLQRAASAPGQQTVRDYFVDPMDITNENYLPDLSEINIPAPVVIVISDDSSVSLEGPTQVSSPTSDTQIFEFPNLSPIPSDD